MSSHLLNNKEFQLIADFLYMQGVSKQGVHAHDIKTTIGFKPGTDEHFKATEEEINEHVKYFVRAMYNLNRLALTTRYGEEYSRNDELYFTPCYNPMARERDALEAMRSLRYQCGEYITSETEYYKVLDKLIGKLCENIFFRE